MQSKPKYTFMPSILQQKYKEIYFFQDSDAP